MTEGKRSIIQGLGSTIKETMETEMDEPLGYPKSERSDSDNYHNGYNTKHVNSGSLGVKNHAPCRLLGGGCSITIAE